MRDCNLASTDSKINGQDIQCTYNITLWHVRATTVLVEKQIQLHILSVCVCVACPTVQYFSALSHKQARFPKIIY